MTIGAAWAAAMLMCLSSMTGAALAESQSLDAAETMDYCKATPLTDSQEASLDQQVEDRMATPPLQRAVAALKIAGHAIALAQPDLRRCKKVFGKGQARYDRELKKQTRRVKGNAGAADSSDPAIREVQQRLRDAFIADQAARLAYLELKTDDREGADYWAQRLSTAKAIVLDGRNTAMLKTLLEDYDWIDRSRFGNRIASHAWVIAQHADADPDFQEKVLQRMQPYLATDGVRKRDYAYLYDRVAVNRGEPQRFGTQPMDQCNADGSLAPKPLEDPDGVDERRAEFGLEPMAQAMAEMAARRC